MTKEEAKKKIKELVLKFEANLESYKQTDYKEARLRIDYLDPFFEALGWDISNKKNIPEDYREVIYEDKIKMSGMTKEPDYGFRVNGVHKFFLEAKKPSIIVKESQSSAFQVRKYGWNKKLAVSILSDFEEFAVYNCTVPIDEDYDNASTMRIKYIHYKDYDKNFDYIWELFGRDNVFNGVFDEFVKNKVKIKASEDVDVSFLNSLDKWRDELAQGIIAANKKISEEDLNLSVQKILDRIVFLRIAEDRLIEPIERLKKCTKEKDVYAHLFEYFEEADKKYNSGLFNLSKDDITKNIKVFNKTIISIISKFYKTPYDFAIIPIEILGYAYEQFLGKKIYLDKFNKLLITEKPEVKKAGGVYYTPQYIVEYVVKNTIGKLIENKTPEQIAEIKICDPSCGSGSFLIGAYSYLLDYHLKYYLAQKKRDNKVLTPDNHLTSAIKKRILLNNIFGVDIDKNAIEVTKLSLLLKALENETIASINQSLNMFQQRVLPTLDENIKSGNSLVDTDFYDINEIEFDVFTEKIIKPFNWKQKFPQVFSKSKGFDVVIGNPPWVSLSGRFGNEVLNEKAQNYLLIKYKGNTYRPNLYEYFVHRGLDLVKNNGLFSFIVPDRLGFNAQFIELRKKILENYTIEDLMYKAKFPNIVTDTLIFRIKKEKPDENTTINVGEFDKFFQVKKQFDYLKTNDFQFDYQENNLIQNIINLIFNNQNKTPLKDLFETKTGVILDTSKVSNKKENENQKVILKGKSITKYSTHQKFYVDYTKENIKGGTNDINKLSAAEKVLIRKTGIPLYATYDNSGIFPEQSLYFIFNNKTKMSLKYITALINSKIFNFIYLNVLVTNKESTPQIKKVDLDKFPIRVIDFANKEDVKIHDLIVQYVETILKLNEKLKTTIKIEEVDSLKGRTVYIDEQIDNLVCDLYNLTEEEKELVLR